MTTGAISEQTIKTAVSRDELDSRRDRVLRAMAAEGFDCLVLTTPHTVFYLTGIELGGFWSQQALVIGASGESRFVLRRIEMNWRDLWGPQTWATEWMAYTDDQLPADVIADAIRAVAGTPQRLGMELNRTSITHEAIERIRSAVGAADILSAAHIPEALRVIKTQAEIGHMRRAGAITRLGIEAAAEVIRRGGTDADGAGAAFVAMCEHGSEFFADSPFVATGPKTAMAHARWTRSAPSPGEVVPIYMSASIHRYQCPSERTYTKGDPDARTAHMLETLAQASERVAAEIRPGMRSHDADRLARDLIEDAGYGEFFVNRLAYSIGIGLPPVWWENEIMQLRPNDDREVQEGMTFHLVPALHVPGIGFLSCSWPIAITSHGGEPLSDLPLRVKPL